MNNWSITKPKVASCVIFGNTNYYFIIIIIIIDIITIIITIIIIKDKENLNSILEIPKFGNQHSLHNGNPQAS